MKIGIDARMLGPQCAGLGRYIEQLVKHLENVDKRNRYVLFMGKDNIDSCNLSNKNFKKVLANIPWYTADEQLKLGKIIKNEKVDIMHFPHFNVPIFYSDPSVVTIHDLIMFHYRRREATTLGPMQYYLKDKVHRFVVKRAARKAKKIITVSEFSKNDIHETLKVPKEKIEVTYLAPYLTSGEIGEHEILNKNNIDKSYVLYVGNAYPHKNLEQLINVWKSFEQKYGSNYQLVLAGKESSFYKKIKQMADGYDSIIFTDFVTDHELNILYKNADLFIMPSLYEGFGLPVLEALKAGVPVTSSNKSSLPEILGEAAIYFDPENKQQMMETIYRALTDGELRYELKLNSRVELDRYHWDTTAQKTLNIYKSQ